jgi:hypothetical protein
MSVWKTYTKRGKYFFRKWQEFCIFTAHENEKICQARPPSFQPNLSLWVSQFKIYCQSTRSIFFLLFLKTIFFLGTVLGPNKSFKNTKETKKVFFFEKLESEWIEAIYFVMCSTVKPSFSSVIVWPYNTPIDDAYDSQQKQRFVQWHYPLCYPA